jgi:RHS repeat-associated protein
MWQTSNISADWLQGKHVYVGEDRIATKYNSEGNDNTQAEKERTYYYHSDHLGSAQTVTNWRGQVHERLEYTPYGELWIDWKSADAPEDSTPFRFTGKEPDPETGLYYYGARYLDPKTSRWISGDPALGEYLPSAPVDDEAKKRNGNLPGMGGVFNYVNLHVYHYAGNNPVIYIDPDGRITEEDFSNSINRIKTVVNTAEIIGSIIQDVQKPEARTIKGLREINNQLGEVAKNIQKEPVLHIVAAVLAGSYFGLGANKLVDTAIEKLDSLGIGLFPPTYTLGFNISPDVGVKTSIGILFDNGMISLTNENTFRFNFSSTSNLQLNINFGRCEISTSTGNVTFNSTRFKIGVSFSSRF